MKKLLDGLFYVPKYGKVQDKVMVTRVVLFVTVTILSLAAISFSALAYFADCVRAQFGIIQTAVFNAEIVISDTNGESVNLTDTPEGKTAQLAAGSYTVTLTQSGTAETGFCVVTLGTEVYRTQQLGVDVNAPEGQRGSILFYLDLGAPETICILPHWGTSSYYSGDMNRDHCLTSGETIRTEAPQPPQTEEQQENQPATENESEETQQILQEQSETAPAND